MSPANAALTPRARLKVARLVVEDGYPISEVAARFQCSLPMVKRWVERYQAGDRSMRDHSSRPHAMPAKTPPTVTRRLVSLRPLLRSQHRIKVTHDWRRPLCRSCTRTGTGRGTSSKSALHVRRARSRCSRGGLEATDRRSVRAGPASGGASGQDGWASVRPGSLAISSSRMATWVVRWPRAYRVMCGKSARAH